jgi:adenosine deaminase
MSDVSMNDEYALVAEAFGLTEADLNGITIEAIRSGFGDWSTRQDLIKRIMA